MWKRPRHRAAGPDPRDPSERVHRDPRQVGGHVVPHSHDGGHRVGGAEGSHADRGACPVDILGEALAALDQVLGLLRYSDSDVGAEPH